MLKNKPNQKSISAGDPALRSAQQCSAESGEDTPAPFLPPDSLSVCAALSWGRGQLYFTAVRTLHRRSTLLGLKAHNTTLLTIGRVLHGRSLDLSHLGLLKLYTCLLATPLSPSPLPGNLLCMLCFCDFAYFRYLTQVELCSICLSMTGLFL